MLEHIESYIGVRHGVSVLIADNYLKIALAYLFDSVKSLFSPRRVPRQLRLHIVYFRVCLLEHRNIRVTAELLHLKAAYVYCLKVKACGKSDMV